jgi:uncharacterized protein YjdB
MRCFRNPLAWAALLALSCSSPTGVDGSAGLDVAAVSVDPSASTLIVGTDLPLRASVMDVDGNVVPNVPVVWTVRDPAIAAVSAAGVVTGRAVGSTQVAASAGGRSAVASITVQLPPVATVAVQPATPSLLVGASVTLSTTLADAAGAVLTNRAVTWVSSDPGVATVTDVGLVAAIAPGTATITATSEGKTGVARVTVTPVPLATVAVQPSAVSLTAGGTATLTPVMTDVNGAPASRPVTWTSSDTRIAGVSAAGIVTGAAPGTATITAESEGKTGTATVTVTSVPAASVTVEPATVTVQSLRTTTLTATVKDAAGNVLAGRAVKWASSNLLVATVSESGVVTGLLPGTATISAAVDGKSGSTTVTVTLVPVASVAVQPKTASLTVGQTIPLHAVVTDANNAVTDRSVTWASDNEAVAKVSLNDGVVTALAPGKAIVTATSEGKADAATVTVALAPVASVVVSPPNNAIAIGQTTTLSASVTDIRGVPVVRPVEWGSSNNSVAVVSLNGVVTGMSAGSVTITATSEGIKGTASVTVTTVPVASVTVQPTTANLFVGQTTVLQATVTDANGTVVADRPVNWLSSNSLVATVSETGVLTAVAPGSATISASAGGKSGSASVVVTLVPVASVVLAPPAATVIAGQTTTLVPTIRDANGAQVTRPISWATNNSAVATVSSTGVVTAVAPGDATITATSEGKSGNATVTVVPVPVGTVTVTPATKSLVAGSTTTLAVVVKDANGTTVTNRVVTWSTSDPLVATVSPTGVVTAVAPGAATITATSEGKSDGSAITVTPVPVANVTVEPPTMTLTVGQTAAATAVVKDANGNVLTGRVVTWISSNPLIATVSATGVVTGVARGGPVFITASSENRNGSTAVTVTEIPVGSVSVPATATLVAGQSTTLTAVVKDANGAVLTDRVVTWSSSNTNVATVSQTGVVKSLITGEATITATTEGKSGSTALTVTPAAVGSVTLQPSTPTVVSSSTVTITATVKDINGTTVTDRVVTWKSSNDAVATVSASGVVTGLKAGTATITATSESKSGTATVTVVPGPAATVTVAPAAATVKDGAFVQLGASAVDARGNPITGRAFTWTSSNGGVATVSSSGRVTGRKPGVATITATLDGADDTSQITVTP